MDVVSLSHNWTHGTSYIYIPTQDSCDIRSNLVLKYAFYDYTVTYLLCIQMGLYDNESVTTT